MLDMPALSSEIEAVVEANTKAIEGHREYIAELSPLSPQWARQLSAITDLESIGRIAQKRMS